MDIKDIMTKKVVFIGQDSTVLDAARLMQKHNVGAIPVCDSAGAIKGIVTDRDIVVRNVAHGTNPQTLPVKDVMTSQVTTVMPTSSLWDVSKIMSQQKIRRLPVVENGKLVGMISLGDIATSSVNWKDEASEALSDISTPSKPENI